MADHTHTDNDEVTDLEVKWHLIRHHPDDVMGWELDDMKFDELHRFHCRMHQPRSERPIGHTHGAHRHASPGALATHLIREHEVNEQWAREKDWEELERLHSDDHYPDEKFSWDPRNAVGPDVNTTDGDERDELARHFIARMPYDETETNVEQMKVYIEAFELFAQRNSVYEDLWKVYGWMDTLTHVRSKALRLVRKFWRDDPAEHDDSLLDDAMDLLNYCVFFIRNFRQRNKWGW